MSEELVVALRQEYDVQWARSMAAELGQSIGLSRRQSFHLMTAVSELANNIIFHTKCGGVIRCSVARQGGNVGIEIVAEDNGPGIADIDTAMQDGYSTSGSLGSGLPGARRLMDEFDITSDAATGTRIVARLWKT